MEATQVRISHRFSPKFTGTKNFNNSGGKIATRSLYSIFNSIEIETMKERKRRATAKDLILFFCFHKAALYKSFSCSIERPICASRRQFFFSFLSPFRCLELKFLWFVVIRLWTSTVVWIWCNWTLICFFLVGFPPVITGCSTLLIRGLKLVTGKKLHCPKVWNVWPKIRLCTLGCNPLVVLSCHFAKPLGFSFCLFFCCSVWVF